MGGKDGAKRRGDRLDYEETATADAVAAYLEELAQGLRSGSLDLDAGEQHLRAGVGSDVDLEVEARRRKGKVRVSVTLKFRASEEAAHAEGARATADSAPEAPVPAGTIPNEMSF